MFFFGNHLKSYLVFWLENGGYGTSGLLRQDLGLSKEETFRRFRELYAIHFWALCAWVEQDRFNRDIFEGEVDEVWRALSRNPDCPDTRAPTTTDETIEIWFPEWLRLEPAEYVKTYWQEPQHSAAVD